MSLARPVGNYARTCPLSVNYPSNWARSTDQYWMCVASVGWQRIVRLGNRWGLLGSFGLCLWGLLDLNHWGLLGSVVESFGERLGWNRWRIIGDSWNRWRIIGDSWIGSESFGNVWVGIAGESSGTLGWNHWGLLESLENHRGLLDWQ
jgi:hypothetical protein